MTANESAAKAANDSTARLKAADDETLLAAEAFSFGMFDKYFQARCYDINRRINSLFGTTGDGASTAAAANPTDLGKPNT